MASECIFCSIANGDIPAEKILENDDVIAFNDINPVAPVHVLIIPREHIATFNDLKPEHDSIIAKMFDAARLIAKKMKIDESGYRTIINCNSDSGQEVFHLHMHILGGKRLERWVRWTKLFQQIQQRLRK